MNYFKTPEFKALISTVGLFLLISLSVTGFFWLVMNYGTIAIELAFISIVVFYMFGAYQGYLQKYRSIEDYKEDNENKNND